MFAVAAPSHRQSASPAREDETAVQDSLILHIAHDGAHSYRARMFDEENQVGSPTYHSHIEEAIRWYGEQAPVASVQAFRIWYGGWCAGSFSLAQMRQDADDIADRLLVLALVER
ncbi:MAG: hypothetical protein V4679_07850 [Pseudomonadota bacterium]